MSNDLSAAHYASENTKRLESLREKLDANPDLLSHFAIKRAEGVFTVALHELHSTAAELKELGFTRLDMVTAVDRGDEFELVYELQSDDFGVLAFIKSSVPRQAPIVDSFTDLWPSANWQEREVYDLMGIEFRNHPDLRRILLTDDWEGHPLRKDYQDDSVIPRPDYI